MLGEIHGLVNDLVRDDVARIGPEQRYRAVAMALAQYSKDRPRRVVEDVTAAGGQSIPLPDGALRVDDVEYPAGRVPPVLLPRAAWGHYHAPSGVQLLFPREIPAGAALRLTVRRPHVLTEDASTIPETDTEALASYAAAILFDQVAATTSGDSNPTIPADAVNHGAKPENFAKRAERMRQRYYDLLGIDVKRTQPASAVAVQPLAASDGGWRLTHRRRWR